MSTIFISYSHEDKDYAFKLVRELERWNLDVWIDQRIDYGTQWPRVIEKHVDACGAFIVIMSDNSRDSIWVQNELARATRKRKIIFPLLLLGEPWLSVEATHYVDVIGGRMPPTDFFDRIASVVTRSQGGQKSELLDDEDTETLLDDILAFLEDLTRTKPSDKAYVSVEDEEFDSGDLDIQLEGPSGYKAELVVEKDFNPEAAKRILARRKTIEAMGWDIEDWEDEGNVWVTAHGKLATDRDLRDLADRVVAFFKRVFDSDSNALAIYFMYENEK